MSTITGRFLCDNCYAVYLGDATGVTQKVFPSNTDLGYIASGVWAGHHLSFNANPNDWFYIIAWSDLGGRQGLLGSFLGTTVLNTGDAGWEVFPTRQTLPVSTNVPDMATINGHIAAANSGGAWVNPFVGPDYINTNLVTPITLDPAFISDITSMGANPKWVWHDSGNDTRIDPKVPFLGFNHDEFLIFRFPLKLVGPSQSPCEEAKDNALEALEALVGDKYNHLSNVAGGGCASFPTGTKGDPNEPGEGEGIPCKTLEIPAARPCFYLHWGDGPRDIIETEDFEVLVLSVCNTYNNVLFKGVQITGIEVVHADGSPVELQPDGTPCVQIVPSKLICLCEVGPCSCSHIELALKSDGAIEGPYKIKFSYCIEEISLVMTERGRAEFDIELIVS